MQKRKNDSKIHEGGNAPATSLQTQIKSFEAHERIQGIVISPNRKLVASASANEAHVWDTATSERRWTLKNHSITTITFRSDSKALAFTTQEKEMKLWVFTAETCHRILDCQSDYMRTIAFSLGSKVLATGSNDGKIRLWEATTHVRLKELQGHEEPINAIAFSPNGEVLASGSDDGTVRLWNTASGEHLRTLKGHRGPIMAIAFSLNGEVLASGSDDNTVRVWNTASGKQLLTLNGIKNTEDNSCSFHSVAFSTHTLLAYGKDSGEETKIYHLCQELNLCGNIKEAIA